MFLTLDKYGVGHTNECYNHNLECIKSAFLSLNFPNAVQVAVYAYSVTLSDEWRMELYEHACMSIVCRVWYIHITK